MEPVIRPRSAEGGPEHVAEEVHEIDDSVQFDSRMLGSTLAPSVSFAQQPFPRRPHQARLLSITMYDIACFIAVIYPRSVCPPDPPAKPRA